MDTIDEVQLLHLAYAGTKEQRIQATAQLDALLCSPSAPHYLLHLVQAGTNPLLPPEQSLSALLYAKNSLLHTTPEEILTKAPESLAEIEKTLFAGAFRVSAAHRRIICVCATTLISQFAWDYMGELLPMVAPAALEVHRTPTPTLLVVQHATAMLELLYTYTKRFRVPKLEPIARQLEVCGVLAPVLFELLDLKDFHVSKLVFKIAECVLDTALQPESGTTGVIPAHALDSWFAAMAAFPGAYHEAASSADGGTYAAYVKCVKRIGVVTFSVLNDATRRKKPVPMARHFLKAYAERFLEVWRQWLGFCVRFSDRDVHKKSEMFAIRYIKLCTLDEVLYTRFLRPDALQIIEHLLFPYLCYSVEDAAVFADESDLAEYAQYMMEEGVEGGELSQRQAASNAILAMIGGKKKFHDAATLLQGMLHALTAGLSLERTAANFPRLYGFLRLLSVLRKYLREDTAIWQGQMAQVLMQFVVPHVLPDVPFAALRCIALAVCQRYCRVPMPTEGDFASFVGMICSLVQDADARVRLTAIDAMCTLLEMKRARGYLTQTLVPLVEECLYFLNRVQTTFVPAAILHLATHFAPELTPVMGKLGSALVQQFLATAFDLQQQQEEDGGEVNAGSLAQMEKAAFSADALLDAVYTVVLSCSESNAVFLSIRADVLRLVKAVLLQPECFDFMDKTLGIFLHVVNFSGNAIPPECWELLPLLFKSIDAGTGVDFFDSIEEVLDNFISGATVEYFTNQLLMEASLGACRKMLIGGVVCTMPCQVAAAQLIEAMLHQAKGCTDHPGLLDAYLPQLVSLLLQSLIHPDAQQSSQVPLRVWIIAAMMDCFFYDAAATFDLLVRTNAYPQFFEGFFHLFHRCQLVHQQQTPQEALAGPAPASGDTTSDGDHANKRGCREGGGKQHGNEAKEAVLVTTTLSILTRKVIILGLTSLLNFAVGAGATQQVAPTTFLEHYLQRAVMVVQYCIFTNERFYEARCRVSERNLRALHTDEEIPEEEDVDLNSEDVLGLDGADDTEAGAEVYEDLSQVDDWDDVDDSKFLTDEGDDYASPIDDINEVQFFLQWLSMISHEQQYQLEAVRLNQFILRPESEYIKAEHVAGRYQELCKELEQATSEGYKRRVQQALR